MQWNIGFSRGDIKQIIREKKFTLNIKWMTLGDCSKSMADPFIFKDKEGNLQLFFEDFSDINPSKYGTIVMATFDNEFNIIAKKRILDAKSHVSYPFLFIDDNKTYIIPETSQQRKVSAYEFDFDNKCLINEKVILNNLPMLDSTIYKYNGKYWLFATLGENGYDHSQLHIYYADSLLGTYQPHRNNPVKNNINGSRPAGNIITIDGELYRPAQNCGQHYGESISINKITMLSEYEFSEEFCFKIEADKKSKFNAGIHTINIVDDIIVIDGIRMMFRPLRKWKIFLKKKIRNRELASV